MECVRAGREGAVITVRVKPNAGRNQIEGVIDGCLVVRLASPPIEGAANRALIHQLAEALNWPKRDIEIVRGQRGRQKSVLVLGASAAEITRRLARFVNGPSELSGPTTAGDRAG